MALFNAASDAEFQGYLEKQSLTLFKTMRKRWVVLKDDKLHCYKTKEMKTKPTKTIDILQFSSIIVNEDRFTMIHHDNCKENRTFKPENKSMLLKWIKMIKPRLMCDETGNHIISLSKYKPVLKKTAEGYKVYYYASTNTQVKENAFVDLNEFTAIEIYHHNDGLFKFSLTDSESKHDRTFRTHHHSVFNEWVDIISPILKENETKEAAIKDGLLDKKGKYQHKVTKQVINCPNMVKLKSDNPLHCNIYHSMIATHQHNLQNLHHLEKYRHYQNEYEDKPICKYNDECKSYIRCENGVDKNEISDQCHMILYRHPPRTRHVKLAENINSLLINGANWDNHELYEPTGEDMHKYSHNKKNGYLKALISETKSNNFGYDLCLSCAKGDDECKHDPFKSQWSILQIVDEKMECLRHKLMGKPLNRGEMLSLVLYTGLIHS